jgi:hypothetical protein
VLDALADGPMTARDLGRTVPELAVPVMIGTGRQATSVAAHTRLLLVLGFAGDVVRARPTGTWINGQYRWAAADGWIPGGIDAGLDKRTAAAELTQLWLRSFGPATRADLQWWAGWTSATTTRALADVGAVEVVLDDGPGFLLLDDLEPVDAPEPWVALLPGLDPTTMGWKQRSWYLDPAVAAAVFDRNGNGGPTVWVDGRIVGSWVQRRDGTIAVRCSPTSTRPGATRSTARPWCCRTCSATCGSASGSPRRCRPRCWSSTGVPARPWAVRVRSVQTTPEGIDVGFLDGLTGNASRGDPRAVAEEYARLFAQGEQVHAAYQLVRDVFIFTDRRLILVDKQGVTGRKVQYHSVPYKSITHFSVETAGTFDLDAELTIWISGGQGIAKQFGRGVDVYEVQALLAAFVAR